MKRFREGVPAVAGIPVVRALDYSKGIDGLPVSDVLKFVLENGSSLVIRPSGTEPKLKLYAMIRMPDEESAAAFETQAVQELEGMLK
ncbi:MAG: hypothetical protein IIZ14_04800 [Solobacterium sp.]|nr:hypothetical protein [Solobacterium sp.]